MGVQRTGEAACQHTSTPLLGQTMGYSWTLACSAAAATNMGEDAMNKLAWTDGLRPGSVWLAISLSVAGVLPPLSPPSLCFLLL